MDLIGQRLGNYRLVRLLGEGGYAQVYLGQHVLLNMRAAIKVLHAPLAEREIKRFCQEAQAVARLAHRNIVRLLEFDAVESLVFLVMEYAPGGTLRQRHPEGVALPLETIQPYVAQIASALTYIHAHRLIHRDLKPDNLLIGSQQQILLGDFGLAILAQSSSQFKPQEIVGTIAYMAPEQLQGKPRPASDQYALAVLIYEWLTGERPFTGSLMEVVAQQAVMAPRPLRERVPTISQTVEEVVLMALAKDPKARFASVATFASAFAVACQATFDTPPTPQPLPRRSL